MSQEKYDLVFSGELVPGFELAQVKSNVQALFRIDEAKTNVLFSGREIQLKKDLDADTANKYRVAMKKAGARVAVVLSSEAAKQAQAPASAPQSGSQNNAPPGLQKNNETAVNKWEPSAFDTELGAQPQKAAEARQVIDAPDFKIAAPGEDMLPEEYRLPLASVEVDTSDLSVAPQNGNLVHADELGHLPSLEIDIPDFDVAPAGSDVLKPEERRSVAPANVDVSALTLSEVGAQLAQPKKAPPPPPNVDHIKLER